MLLLRHNFKVIKSLKLISLILAFLLSFVAISCNKNDDDIDSLKGKTFKCDYESSSYAYCITFDTNSSGRLFRLYRTSTGYSYDDTSISDFTYSYEYPNLSVTNLGGSSMFSSHYDFLSSSVFSDGNYIWSEVNLKVLISSGSGGGNSSGETTYGKLSVSPTTIQLDANSGSRSIVVTSNTSWSVSVNNSGSSINGLKVSTTSGNGNGTVVVSYDAVTTQYYQQQASITFYYTGAGNVRLSETVTLYRKRLP